MNQIPEIVSTRSDDRDVNRAASYASAAEKYHNMCIESVRKNSELRDQMVRCAGYCLLLFILTGAVALVTAFY